MYTCSSRTRLLQALCLVVLLVGSDSIRNDESASASVQLSIQTGARGQFQHKDASHSVLNTTGGEANQLQHGQEGHPLTPDPKRPLKAQAHVAAQHKEHLSKEEVDKAKKEAQEDTGGTRVQVLGQVAVLTRYFGFISLAAILVAAGFEYFHMRWSDVDWTRHDALLDADPDTLDHIGRFGVRGFGAIALVYFRGDGAVIGVGIFMGTICLIIAGTMIEKQMNFVSGVFWDAMQEKDYDKFTNGLSCFLVMLPGAFLIWAYQKYINGMLQIHWQHSLVRRLEKAWLGHCAYCVGQLRAPYEKVALENPDQRIEEDAYEFVKSWLVLGFGLLQAIPTFVVWMPIVLSLSPDHIFAMKSLPVFRPWLLCAAIIWCFLTSAVTHLVGKNIIILSYAKERYYADFRMGLSRIRHNADQIAMLHAEDSEQRDLESHFEKIKRCFWERIKIDKVMNIVQFLLGQGSDLFPLIFLAHAYFTGNVGLGHFIRIRMAVTHIQDSMSWFVTSYTTIAKFRAVSNRLVEMLEHCDKVKDVRLLAPKLDPDMHQGGLKLTSARGRLPTGTLLWCIEDLAIDEGQWTLIQGSEGSGKTTLLRLLAGAWPVQEGTELRLGAGVEAFVTSIDGPVKGMKECEDEKAEDALPVAKYPLAFVPVGAYRLRQGLYLKKAVCYPEDEDDFDDDDVAEALKDVGLGKLLVGAPVDPSTLGGPPEDGAGCQNLMMSSNPSDGKGGSKRRGSKDSEGAWPALHCDHGDRMLSAGESQRLELAHVLLTRPRWCFLDEPVSHVAEEEKEVLFSMLRSRLKGSSTLVTITHDVAALSALHDMTLALSEGQLSKVPSPP